MKKIIFFVFIFYSFESIAQKIKMGCSYRDDIVLINDNFMSNSVDRNSILAVNKILGCIGLPSNFILYKELNTENASSFTYYGTRYIGFDDEWINSINSNWAKISILAHEIGHHLCGHTNGRIVSNIDQQKKELEADEFSGFVIGKLGGEIDDAIGAMEIIGNDKSDINSSHPHKLKRILAIKKGFENSKKDTKIKVNNKLIIAEESSEDLFYQALELQKNSKNNEAIVKYTKAIKINEFNTSAINNRGAMYTAIGNYDSALNDFNKIIQYNLNSNMINGIAFLNIAIIHLQKGNYQSAIAILDVCKPFIINSELVNSFDHAIVFLNKGICYMRLGDYNNALKEYNNALKIRNDFWGAYFRRGELNYIWNKKGKAKKDLKIGCLNGGINESCILYNSLLK